MANPTDVDYLKILAEHDPWNRRHLMAMFACFGIPGNFADFGCGTGSMVELAHRMGIDSLGIDIHDYNKPWYKNYDLTIPLPPEKTYQLVVSLEVGEHIPQSSDAVYASTVARHVKHGNGLLVFTAAHPGQEGEGHVNTRSAIYWRTLFHNQGLNYQKKDAVRLALLWSNIKSPLYWLPANVQVFSR